MTLRSVIESGSSASDLRIALAQLEMERAAAFFTGLDHDVAYMDDLREEIDEVRSAYVGLAVTEIAALRGEIAGALNG